MQDLTSCNLGRGATELGAQDAAAEQEEQVLVVDAEEAAAQEAGEQAVREAEADADDEEVQGDFVFDASGARIGAGHAPSSAA